MAQSVERLTSAQVMISRFVSLSPTLGSVLTAQSLEPAWDSVPPSLSLPHPSVHSVSLCFSKKNKCPKLKKIIKWYLRRLVVVLMGNVNNIILFATCYKLSKRFSSFS